MAANPLRDFSTTQIEQAIAKALGTLAGGEFLVKVSSSKFVASEMSELTGKAERVDIAFSATQKTDPVDIVINFVEPDGTTSEQVHVGANKGP